MRATRAHRDNRRSHHALDAVRLTKDTKTGSLHQRHRLDMATGMYRGRKILVTADTATETLSAPSTASKA
jgi:ribosomal protein L32